MTPSPASTHTSPHHFAASSRMRDVGLLPEARDRVVDSTPDRYHGPPSARSALTRPRVPAARCPLRTNPGFRPRLLVTVIAARATTAGSSTAVAYLVALASASIAMPASRKNVELSRSCALTTHQADTARRNWAIAS